MRPDHLGYGGNRSRVGAARAALGEQFEYYAGPEGKAGDPRWLGGVLIEELEKQPCSGRQGRQSVLLHGLNATSQWISHHLDKGRYEVSVLPSSKDRADWLIDLETDSRLLSIADLGQLTVFDVVISVMADSTQTMCDLLAGKASGQDIPVINVDDTLLCRAEQDRQREMRRRVDELRLFLSDIRQRTVLFVASNVYFNQLRISSALRARGWTTVAISLHYDKGRHQADYYDHLWNIDLDVLLPALYAMRDIVLHSQGWLNAYHIPVLIDAHRHESARHVAEMMDVQSFFFPADREKEMEPYMRRCWGEGALAHTHLQKRCEQYLLQWCDGVLFCGGKIHQEKLLQEKNKVNGFLNFPSYPLRRFFAEPLQVEAPQCAEERWRLVFAGGVPPYGGRYPGELFGDAQILPMIRQLVSQGHQVDVFNNPNLISSRHLNQSYPEYQRLADEEPLFRFQRGRHPWEITHTIKDYHFGLMIYRFDEVLVGDLHYKAIVPSKFFQYMEAGLPVLVSERFESVCELVEEYGVGVIVRESELSSLVGKLKVCDYSRLRENVLQAREALAMDDQVKRLESLYQGDSPSCYGQDGLNELA